MTRLVTNHPYRAELEDIVKQFFTGVIHAQDPETGLWALVIDQRDYPGMWLETTGSSMFVYSICRLVEAGVLPADPYLACARRGYNGLQQRIGLGHQNYPYLSDACQGTAPRLDLNRWIQSHRQDNNFHVFGPFLSAEEALWRLSPPETAIIGDLKASENLSGQILNVGGSFFFNIPELFTSPELTQFQTLIIERNAIDNNHANVAAYPEKLTAFVNQGGTLFMFEQENKDWLIQAFSEFKPILKPDNEEKIVEITFGEGRIFYCKDYPELKSDMSESKRVAVLQTFVKSYMQDI